MNVLKYDPLRWVEDIGMFAMDRPIYDFKGVEGSCVHATKFCLKTCYNNKLYTAFPKMHEKDVKNENWWQSGGGKSLGETIAKSLKYKKKFTKRARLMTRGEALKQIEDVGKVKAICEATPDTLWWLPTRAWRDPILFTMIRKHLLPLENLAVCASMDPSNTKEEWRKVKKAGMTTMFFGDDSMGASPLKDRFFKCPKTFKGMKGHCAICKAGCFGAKTAYGKRADVHLLEH